MNDILDVKNKILNIKKEIDKLADLYNDDIEFVDTIKNISSDNKFGSIESIENYFNDKINIDRTLRVGIVGRVKAGKSSLLNSILFEGKDILPKAATPMTAALTYIEYSDKNYIEVEFVTEEDIKNYKKVYDQFEEKLNKKIDELKERENSYHLMSPGSMGMTSYYNLDDIKERAMSEVSKENEYLSLGYDNYKDISNASKSVYNEVLSDGVKRIDFNNVEEIEGKLKAYVGVSGKYTNFVKSLNLHINLKELEKVSVLDTPGFNDPVESRNRKASELLQQCDVIFILMPCTQSFTSTDKDVINKILKKEGIHEIYVILSKIDDSLNAPDNLNASGGDLEKAVKLLLSKQYQYIKKNFKDMSVYDDTFDCIIKDIENRVLYSSGICDSLIKKWGNWNSSEETVFKNFADSYPLYFDKAQKETSIHWLNYLANIDKVKFILQSVADKKEDILKTALNNFEKTYMDNAEYIKSELKDYVRKRERRLEIMDINTLSKKINELEIKCRDLDGDINYVAKKSIDEWKFESIDNGLRLLGDFFNEASSKVEGAKEEKTHHYTTGMLWWKEEHNDPYTTINTNQVINSINLYKNKFNEQICITLGNMYMALRNLLISKIYSIFDDKNLEVRESDINRAINAILNEYLEKKVIYQKNTPILPNGVIERSSAIEFISEADRYLQSMREDFREILVDENIGSLANKLKSIDFGKETLEKQKLELETSRKEVENKKRVEEKWIQIKSKIDSLF